MEQSNAKRLGRGSRVANELNGAQRRYRAGTTLIEVLIAVFILATVSLGMYQAFRGIIMLQRISHIRTVATYLANEEYEVVRNLPYQNVGLVLGIPSGVLEPTENITREGVLFTVTRTVRNLDDPFDGTLGGAPDDLSPADYKLVEIEVTCVACGGFEGVTVSGNVAPLGLETSVGNGALFVQVIDSLAQPVVAANVHIENLNIIPNVIIDDVTDANGMLRIIDAPPDLQTYHVEVSKAGYTSEQTYPPGGPGNPNPVKADATVVAGGVTQVTFTIDLVSTVNVGSKNSLCSAIGDYDFDMQGAKIIGTGPDIYKYSQSLVTDVSGLLTLSDMEWDFYDVTGTDGAWDLAGTIPVQPFALNPNSTQALDLILEAPTANRLRVTVLDQGTNLPIANASVRVRDGAAYDVTQLTGVGALTQTDWSGGSGQPSYLDPTKYAIDDGNVDVLTSPGDVLLQLVVTQYVLDGQLTSSTIDFSTGVNYSQITFGPTNQPVETGPNAVRFQVATNNDAATWNYLGPDGTAATYYTAAAVDINNIHNGDRYFRYLMYLHTDDIDFTPNVSDISVTYVNACVPPGQTFFSGLNVDNYTIDVTAAGYNPYNGVAAVNGYTTQTVNLTP